LDSTQKEGGLARCSEFYFILVVNFCHFAKSILKIIIIINLSPIYTFFFGKEIAKI
jgi:hypothetical protein